MNTYLLKIANGYGGRSVTVQATAPNIPAAIVLVCLSEGCQPADVVSVHVRPDQVEPAIEKGEL